MNGTNRFDKKGEALYVVLKNNKVIGIGGLSQDPYLNNKKIGRVRHLYVVKRFRREGIGKIILKEIVDESRKKFHLLTLRTNNDIADEMYCNFGFIKGDNYNYATHFIILKSENNNE